MSATTLGAYAYTQGQMEGSLFGPNGEEIGGTFYFRNTTTQEVLYGSFGGKQS